MLSLRTTALVAALLAPGLTACETASGLWLRNGTIYLDAERAPVESMLLVFGAVYAAGSEAEVREVIATWDEKVEIPGLRVRELDLGGAVAVPGLTDAHGHLEGLGEALESVDLLGCRSLDELVERVAARAAKQPSGSWILGRGWDQTLFPGQAFPEHGALSARVPDHPVFLERVDGHAAFVNARALELAGLSAGGVPEVEGGRVVLDPAGRPSGVLVDAATALVAAKIPPPDGETRTRRILAAQAELVASGLVGMHDMGTAPETLSVLRELERDGRLKLRVASYVWANEGLPARVASERRALGSRPAFEERGGRLRLVGAKLMVDGALGSRGAALLAPYADAPSEVGLLQMSPEVFAARLHEVVAAGLQPATHAIGDRGNRVVLDAYEREFGEPGARARFRPRIEHAQVVAPEDWERFEELGIVPSMQPTHATSDMRWAETRLGPERVAGAYAWRRLAGPHAPLACGSDFPVESPKPLLGLYAARTRQDAGGNPGGGWRADQCLDGQSALAGFTSGAAYAAHEERQRGKLLPGYSADVTVLSVDPIRCEPRALLEARVLATIIGGQIVHSALPKD